MSLFLLGETSVSAGAAQALAGHGLLPEHFFARHAAGDWGVAEPFDQRGNAFALAHGVTRFIIQSSFALPDGELVLVMTTPDRRQTAMLLDREFEDREVSPAEAYARWVLSDLRPPGDAEGLAEAEAAASLLLGAGPDDELRAWARRLRHA